MRLRVCDCFYISRRQIDSGIEEAAHCVLTDFDEPAQPREIGLIASLPQPRPSTRFLKQFIVPSDTHPFVGRIYDLSIVAYHFDNHEELARHADCKYAFDVNTELSTLTRRVESLNLVGSLLWLQSTSSSVRLPVSRYEWLTIAADVFLMRYISVVDCALLLANEIFEVGLQRRKCSIENLKKRVPQRVGSILEELLVDQGTLRNERNARFHHGLERDFTRDDTSFRIAAMHGLRGVDQPGRRINVERSFREGLVELQRTFNRATRSLTRLLNRLYDELAAEFETRCAPRFQVSPFGLERRAPNCD